MTASPHQTPPTPPRPPAQSPLSIGLRHYPMTLVLLLICIGLFVWQVLSGVDASQPTSQDLLHWGANFLPYTLYNEPWRLFSSLLLHIGLMHLMFNMFALYYFGQVAERMFGSVNLLLLFILSGLGGNLLNLALGWQALALDELPVISAGASGGIMGIGMALLVTALLKTSINDIRLSTKSLLWVMAINLGYGFLVSGIDNAGHVGGAITGAILALLYIWQYRDSTNRPQQNLSARHGIVIAGYGVIIALFLATYWYLHQAFTVLYNSQLAQMNI